MPSTTKKCFICQITDNEMPLVRLDYKGVELSICPAHMPVMIHQKEELQTYLEHLDPQ